MIENYDASVPAIGVSGLTKQYPSGTLAVDQLHFDVRQGEIFGFLGPNGAGKTTTIRLILDLIRPTSGTATVLGLDCQRESLAVRQLIGYLPGELSLYGRMSSRGLFRLFAGLRHGQVSWSYVEELCERIEVELDTPYRDLSQGNRRKVGIVLALMAKTPVIILDEPTNGLDPLAQHRVLEMIGEVRDEGRTVFFSSHVLSEVERVCDRVAIIRKGQLAAIEEVASLRGRQVQRIHIRFAEPVAEAEFQALAGVRVIEAAGTAMHLEITGEADEVVKTAAQHHVISIVSEHPSLDEVFMAYYTPNNEGREVVRA